MTDVTIIGSLIVGLSALLALGTAVVRVARNCVGKEDLEAVTKRVKELEDEVEQAKINHAEIRSTLLYVGQALDRQSLAVDRLTSRMDSLLGTAVHHPQCSVATDQEKRRG